MEIGLITGCVGVYSVGSMTDLGLQEILVSIYTHNSAAPYDVKLPTGCG